MPSTPVRARQHVHGDIFLLQYHSSSSSGGVTLLDKSIHNSRPDRCALLPASQNREDLTSTK